MKENQYNSANVSNNSNNDKQKNAYEGPNIEENVPQVIMKKDFMSDVDKRKKRRKQQLNSSTKPPTLTHPSNTIAPQQDKTLVRYSEETPSVNTIPYRGKITYRHKDDVADAYILALYTEQ